MPRPVCAKCSREMLPVKNGIVVEFQARANRPAQGPLGRPEQGPYEQWMGDLLGCEGCGARVVAGYGDRPAWRSFEDEPGYQPPGLVVLER